MTKGPSDLRQRVGLFAAPLVLAAVLLSPAPEALGDAGWRALGIALLMATWWITEAVPIPATSLVPIAAFPLLSIGTIRETTAPYADPVIYLFLGGFLLALGMQRWQLHRRIALRLIRAVGTGPNALVGGFMLSAAVLSMWVSNAATAMMMLPVGLSVIDFADRHAGPEHAARFAVALLLGIAYGCSIGGMGTLIGTPPNVLMAGFFEQQYGIEIGFAEWMLVGLPVVAIGLPVAFLLLTRVTFPLEISHIPGAREEVERDLSTLGPLSRGERSVAVIFSLTAAMWVTSPILEPFVPGLSDTGIAIFGAMLLFVVPVDWKERRFVLDWTVAHELPWGTLVLFGGGLSLAAAFTRTGLSEWIGSSIASLGSLPLVAVIAVVAGSIVFLTELTSNTATTATFLPVIAAMAVGIGENPLMLAVPAVLGASCAFMLPVATPPNAIVYGAGRITIPQMARAGFLLNLVFIALLTALGYTLFGWVFGAEPGVLPDWAGQG